MTEPKTPYVQADGSPAEQPSQHVEVATQCADGGQIAYGGKAYPVSEADKFCPCGGPHWIGQRTVTYGKWEPVENGPSPATAGGTDA